MKNTIGVILITISTFFAPISSRADLLYYSLSKARYLHQEAGGAPVLRPFLPWVFEPRMVFTNIGSSFYSINLTKPGSFYLLIQDLGIDATGNTYDGTSRYSAQGTLDGGAAANGTYVFKVQAPFQPTLTVSNTIVTGTYPAAPNITNLTEAQSIDPSQDFTLKWSAFPGGSTNDLIICWFKWGRSNVVETPPMPGLPGVLDGTATSLLIPAGTLAPGRAYLGRLVFASVKSVVTNQAPGAIGAMMYESQTDFYIKTTGPGDANLFTIVSSIPAQGATGVPTNTSVVLTFNKQWRSSGSGSGAQVGDPIVGMGLSPDGFSLGGGPNSFSPNSIHQLIMNLLPGVPMYDVSGNVIPPETTLTFTTGTGYHKPATPVISNLRIDASGRFQADLLGEANRSFMVEYSTNLSDWTQLTNEFSFDGVVSFGDTSPGTGQPHYFRGVAY